MVRNRNSPPPRSNRWADDMVPENVEAEMVLLNSLIAGDAKLYGNLRPMLTRDVFLQEDHQVLFDVVTNVRDDGASMDGYILRTELERRGLSEDAGGIDYLAAILQAAPNPAHGLQYVKPVVEAYRLRSLDVMLDNARSRIRQTSDAPDIAGQIVEDLQNSLALMVERSDSNDIKTLGQVMDDVMVTMAGGGAPRLPSGIHSLDDKIGGLGMGEMTLIAARPSMGKSLLGKQIADNLAKARVPVFYGNCEENNQKTGRNWLSRNAKIANHRVRRGQLAKAEWEVSEDWKDYSHALPFYLCDRAMTLSALCNVITLAHARYKIKAAFVDYLQLIDAEGGDTREQEVSRISRRLKNLFKRLNIAGIVIAQLNRGNEAGQIRPPRLSDLRDSGQIEQDADVVLLIHRPDFYCRESGNEPTGRVQVIIAKNRDGSREEDVELKADLEHQEFAEPTIIDPFI